MNVDLGTLERWIEGWLRTKRPVRRSLLARADPDTLFFAEESGILRATGLAREVGCDYCEPPHICAITLNTEHQYSYYCPINGLIDIARDDLKLLDFDRAALLRLIAKAAGVPERQILSFANDRLVRIGLVPPRAGARTWMLGYADGLEDENVLVSAVETLRNQFPKGPGLIATSSGVANNMPLPKDYRLVKLRELLVASPAGFAINHDAASNHLGRHKRIAGRLGRPSSISTTKGLWGKLSLEANWPSQIGEQAEHILDHWPDGVGNPPALATIARQLGTLGGKSRR